jgi:hypothetical protein
MWKKERNWFHPPWRDNMEIHMPAITTQERKMGKIRNYLDILSKAV